MRFAMALGSHWQAEHHHTWGHCWALCRHCSRLAKQAVHAGQQVPRGLEQVAVDAGDEHQQHPLQQQLVLQQRTKGLVCGSVVQSANGVKQPCAAIYASDAGHTTQAGADNSQQALMVPVHASAQHSSSDCVHAMLKLTLTNAHFGLAPSASTHSSKAWTSAAVMVAPRCVTCTSGSACVQRGAVHSSC